MKRLTTAALAAALACAACNGDRAEPADGQSAPTATATNPQEVWWHNLRQLCGQSFAGEMVRFDPELDAGWLDRDVIMHVRECSDDEVRIPLHVGENRSRTWVLTRTDTGIRLKHDHRHPDGTEETMSQYGGHTVDMGTAERQEFPAGEFSRDLFEREHHPDGVQNVWAMEIHPGERFSYRLSRFNRDFGADFDLTDPVDSPPPPWVIAPRDGRN